MKKDILLIASSQGHPRSHLLLHRILQTKRDSVFNTESLLSRLRRLFDYSINPLKRASLAWNASLALPVSLLCLKKLNSSDSQRRLVKRVCEM